MSALAADPGPRLRLRGAAGAWTAPELDGQEEELRAGADPARPGWGAEPERRWGRLVTAGGTRALAPVPGDWPAYYRGVAAALRSGGPAPVPAADGVRVLEILEAARRSAASGEVVDIRHG